jgi:hypothetical protein
VWAYIIRNTEGVAGWWTVSYELTIAFIIFLFIVFFVWVVATVYLYLEGRMLRRRMFDAVMREKLERKASRHGRSHSSLPATSLRSGGGGRKEVSR